MKKILLITILTAYCSVCGFSVSPEVKEAVKLLKQESERNLPKKYTEKSDILGAALNATGIVGASKRSEALTKALKTDLEGLIREFNSAYDAYDANLPRYPEVKCPEPNPVSDFEYKFSDDYRTVIITGIKNNTKKVYSFPTVIEDTPVTVIGLKDTKNPLKFGEIEFYIPDGIVHLGIRPNAMRPKKITLKRIPKIWMGNNCITNWFQADRFSFGLTGSYNYTDMDGTRTIYYRYNYAVDHIYDEYLFSRGVDVFDYGTTFDTLTIKKDWYRSPYGHEFSTGKVNKLIFEDGCNYIKFTVYAPNIVFPKTNGLVYQDIKAPLTIPDQKIKIDFNNNESIMFGTINTFYPRDYFDRETMIEILDYRRGSSKNSGWRTLLQFEENQDGNFALKDKWEETVEINKEKYFKRIIKDTTAPFPIN